MVTFQHLILLLFVISFYTVQGLTNPTKTPSLTLTATATPSFPGTLQPNRTIQSSDIQNNDTQNKHTLNTDLSCVSLECITNQIQSTKRVYLQSQPLSERRNSSPNADIEYFDGSTSYINEKRPSYFTISHHGRHDLNPSERYINYYLVIDLVRNNTKVPFPKLLNCTTVVGDIYYKNNIELRLSYNPKEKFSFGGFSIDLGSQYRLGDLTHSFICMYSGLGDGTSQFIVTASLGDKLPEIFRPPNTFETSHNIEFHNRLINLPSDPHYPIITDEEIAFGRLPFGEDADNADDSIDIGTDTDIDKGNTSTSQFPFTYIAFFSKKEYETTGYTKPGHTITEDSNSFTITSIGHPITDIIRASMIVPNTPTDLNPQSQLHLQHQEQFPHEKVTFEKSRTFFFDSNYSPSFVGEEMFTNFSSNCTGVYTPSENTYLSIEKASNRKFTGSLAVQFNGVYISSTVSSSKCNLSIVRGNYTTHQSKIDGLVSFQDSDAKDLRINPRISFSISNYQDDDRKYTILCPTTTIYRARHDKDTTGFVIPFSFGLQTNLPTDSNSLPETSLHTYYQVTTMGSNKSPTNVISLPAGGAIPSDPLPDEDQSLPSDSSSGSGSGSDSGSDSQPDDPDKGILPWVIVVIVVCGLVFLGGIIIGFIACIKLKRAKKGDEAQFHELSTALNPNNSQQQHHQQHHQQQQQFHPHAQQQQYQQQQQQQQQKHQQQQFHPYAHQQQYQQPQQQQQQYYSETHQHSSQPHQNHTFISNSSHHTTTQPVFKAHAGYEQYSLPNSGQVDINRDVTGTIYTVKSTSTPMINPSETDMRTQNGGINKTNDVDMGLPSYDESVDSSVAHKKALPTYDQSIQR